MILLFPEMSKGNPPFCIGRGARGLVRAGLPGGRLVGLAVRTTVLELTQPAGNRAEARARLGASLGAGPGAAWGLAQG